MADAHVEVANLVLIVLSIVVTIIFFVRHSSWIKPGAIKCLSPLSDARSGGVLHSLRPDANVAELFAINNVHHEILGFSINPVSSRRLTRSGWYSPAQYWQAFTASG